MMKGGILSVFIKKPKRQRYLPWTLEMPCWILDIRSLGHFHGKKPPARSFDIKTGMLILWHIKNKQHYFKMLLAGHPFPA
jgi:hypothetical protein